MKWAIVGLAVAACVPKGKYDSGINHAREARAARAEAERRASKSSQRVVWLEQRLRETERLQAESAQDRAYCDYERKVLGRQRDGASLLVGQLRGKLGRLARQVGDSDSRNNGLRATIAELEQRTERLEEARRADDRHLELLSELTGELRDEVSSAAVSLRPIEGAVLVTLDAKATFTPGTPLLSSAGDRVLRGLAKALHRPARVELRSPVAPNNPLVRLRRDELIRALRRFGIQPADAPRPTAQRDPASEEPVVVLAIVATSFSFAREPR